MAKSKEPLELDVVEGGTEETEEGIELPDGYDPPEGVVLSGGEEDELPQELKGKSKKELADLLKKASETPKGTESSLSEGLTKLSEAILKQRRLEEPAGGNQSEQKPGESDEEFWKRASTALFDEKEMKAIFQEASARSNNPRMVRLATQAMTLNKRLLKVENKPLWDGYGEEIETEAKALLKQYGPDAEIYEVAFKNVETRHAREIAGGEQAGEIAKLKARIEELEGGNGPKPARVKGIGAGSGSSLGAAASGTKRRLVVTDEIRQKALEKGLSVSAYLGID